MAAAARRRPLSEPMTNGARRLRVVYFTCVPLHTTANGGHLCCRNHVERLNADPEVELSVVAAGPPANETATLEYFTSRRIDGRFIQYNDASTEVALPWLTRRWPYLHEIEAHEQSHLDGSLKRLVTESKPD